MNGIAWVVEVQTKPGGPWWPWYVRPTRQEMREVTSGLRRSVYKTRVRKYIRQPEVRP